MKTKILFLTLLCVNIISAQLEKAEIYGIGTKITYYMNECGNSIPEAQNKLTFCDSDNNLGVVEKSFGLNDHAIKKIIPNHFNDDEVFLTQNGFSIRKTNGEWENIPRGAIPRGGNGEAAQLEYAVVNNLGQLIFTNGQNYGFQYYDITTKTFDIISYGTTGTNAFYTTKDLAQDTVNGVTYILGRRSISWDIFKFENGILSHINNINSISGSNFNRKLHYKDNKLYLGTTTGLYQLDTSDGSIDNTYLTDSSNYITSVRDIADDNFGNIWVANRYVSNNSAIYKIDLSDDSITAYQLNDSSGLNVLFFNLVVNDAGKVYAVAESNLCGIAELDISSGNPVWTTTTTQDFDDLGFPMMGCNRFVSKHNNKIYLSKTSHSFSSEQGKLEAIVIDDQGNLSGITDNEPTNIARRMLGGQPNAYPSDDGIWYHSSSFVMHIDSTDTFQRFFNSEIGSSNNGFTLDQDKRPTFANTNTLHKFYTPFVFETDDTPNGITQIKKYKDQIWVYSEFEFKLFTYLNNQLVNTIDLGSEYNGFFKFAPGLNDDVYFADRNNGTFYLKKFDMISQATTTLTAPDIGSVRNIIALPSGNMAIICWSGIFVYDGQQLQAFTDADFPGITSLHKGIVNTDGDLFILNREGRRVYIIKDFETTNPDFSTLQFNTGFGGLLPFSWFTNMNSISLDQDGHLWLNRTGSMFKFTVDNTSPQFLNEGVTYGITGLVYIDLNENDQFDDGEAFANQKVAMRTSNKTYETTSNPDGTYFFPYFEGAVDYEITLPTLSPLVVCDDRQRQITPTNLDQNTTLSNFKLLQKNIGSLLVKSSDKEGAWAFSRTGFENTYTTAIGNISFTKTFSNVSLKYAFYNDEDNLGDELPDINDINVYKLEPNSNFHLIENISINPRNHHWDLSVPPSDYTQTSITANPVVTQVTDSTEIDLNLGDINPLDTFIIEIESDLYDPEDFGNVIINAVVEVTSSDFETGTSNNTYFLVPIDPNDPIGFPPLAGPYRSPEEVYAEPPYIEPKEVYSNGPFRSLVQSSFDPNDKLTNPGLPEGVNEIPLNQEWITYTVRFQNEGNFSAKDVFIVDELNPKLDPFSLMPLESSHPYTMESISKDDEFFIKFNFNDIFLDFQANDEEASQGHITFMVKAKDDVALGDIVSNQAEIYFDQNPPIITNLVQHEFIEETLSNSNFINPKADIKIWPNPARGILNIQHDFASKYQVAIYDIQGRLLFDQKFKSNQDQIDVSALDKGIYILSIKSQSGQQDHMKFIKN